MGYRTIDRQPPKPHRTMHKITTPSQVYVQNGTTTDLAIPCFYQEVKRPRKAKLHNRVMHDYFGYPDPTNPDRVCQLPYTPIVCNATTDDPHHPVRRLLNMGKLIPIHLSSAYEGYNRINVIFKDGTPAGVTVREAVIDDKEDWVIRIKLDVADVSAKNEEKKYEFSIFAVSDSTRDIVTSAELVVLPGAC